MASRKFLIVRFITLVVCFALAVVVLALSVSYRATMSDSSSLPFALGVGAATIASLGLIIPLQFVKWDLFVSNLIVEWLVISILWTVWLVCVIFFGFDNTNWSEGHGVSGCDYSQSAGHNPALASELGQLCQRRGALTALSVVAFIFFTGYGVTLLVVTIRTSKRIGGKATWFASVRELRDDAFIRRSENEMKQWKPSAEVDVA